MLLLLLGVRSWRGKVGDLIGLSDFERAPLGERLVGAPA